MCFYCLFLFAIMVMDNNQGRHTNPKPANRVWAYQQRFPWWSDDTLGWLLALCFFWPNGVRFHSSRLPCHMGGGSSCDLEAWRACDASMAILSRQVVRSWWRRGLIQAVAVKDPIEFLASSMGSTM